MDNDKFEVDEQTAKLLADSLEKSIFMDLMERDELNKKIANATAKLKEIRKKFGLGNAQSTRRGGSKKLPKGEGSRKVAQFFNDNPGKSFAIAEIHKATGMPFSSVRNILTREKTKYKEANGLWCMKED